MESKYVVLTKEEYRQMLEAVIRKEIAAEFKAMYEEEIKDLHDSVDLERSSCTYWYNRATAAEKELEELKAKMEGGEAN